MFVTEGPLDPASPLFVGREAELRQMEGWVTHAGSVGAVAGARQTGKTSLLLRLRHSLRDKGLFVFADLEAIYGATLEDCFTFISGEIQEQLAAWLQPGEQLQLAHDSQSFLAFLRQVSQRSQAVRIVIMLDEIGALPLDTSSRLSHTIRAVLTSRHVREEYRRYVFIISGSTDMLKLATGKLSPLKNVTDSIYVPDLLPEEAYQLLQVGFVSCGLQVPQDTYDRVYFWTGGHPYLTQRVGKEVLEHIRSNPGPIDGSTVDAIVHRLIREEDKNLPHTRRALDNSSPQLWEYVRRILAGASVFFSRSNTYLAELELSGAIKADSGNCFIRNQIYRQAFESWQTERSPAPEPPVPPPRPSKEVIRKGLTGRLLELHQEYLAISRQLETETNPGTRLRLEAQLKDAGQDIAHLQSELDRLT